MKIKKCKISHGDTVDSKFKTKMYKTKVISTKVQSSSSESELDDNISDFCKNCIIFQLNCVTYLNMRLSSYLLINIS